MPLAAVHPIWFTAEAIAAWRAEPRSTRGGQPHFSDLAIATALTLRSVFRLALRQTEGLIRVRGSAPNPASARSGSRRAGPQHDEPPGEVARAAADAARQAACASAGRQHRLATVWAWRMAGRAAWQQGPSDVA